MSITAKISLLFLILFGVGFYFFAKNEVNETKRHYREATEEPLVDIANILAALVASDSQISGSLNTSSLSKALETASTSPLQAKIYQLEKTKVDLHVYVTNAKGIVIFDSNGAKSVGADYSNWNDVYQTLRGRYGARSGKSDPLRKNSLLVGAPIRVGGSIVGSLSVAKSNENANLFIVAAKKSVLALAILTFCSVGLLAVLLSFVVTRPLRKLTQYVSAIGAGARPAVPKVSGKELRSLTQAFEKMREALEGRKYVEQYIQALTHELKSPLTAIRGAAELLKENPPAPEKEKFLNNIIKETRRSVNLIEKLLVLSSLQSVGAPKEFSQIDLTALVSEVVEGLTPLAQGKKVGLNHPTTFQFLVHGNRIWLREAIYNLIQNAVEFSPVHSQVDIQIVQDKNSTTVIINDSGPGIPDYALNRIFEKFYSLPRPDTNNKSSGLGLALVREVADLHGGGVRLENRSPNGATASFSLPRY